MQSTCVLDVWSNSGVDGEQFSQLTSVQGGTLILGIEANPWHITSMDELLHYKDV